MPFMAVVVLSGPAAWADDGDTQSLAEGTRDPTADKPPTFSGYLQPQIGFVYRADAKPEDKWNYGAGGSQTGLVVAGAPAADWRYVVHLLVGAELLTGKTRSKTRRQDKKHKPLFDSMRRKVTTAEVLRSESRVQLASVFHP